MRKSIIYKTLDDYVRSITIVNCALIKVEYNFTNVQVAQMKRLHVYGKQTLPLEYFTLLLQKEIPKAMKKEINDILVSGGGIDWTWLVEMVEFHFGLVKKNN